MKSKYNTHVKPYMALIKRMRIDGARELDIRKRLDVGHSAWAEYKNKHTELMEVLKFSKETLVSKLEDTLYQQALKGNPTLLIFALKNLAPEKWGEKIKVDANVNGKQFMESLSKFVDKL